MKTKSKAKATVKIITFKCIAVRRGEADGSIVEQTEDLNRKEVNHSSCFYQNTIYISITITIRDVPTVNRLQHNQELLQQKMQVAKR